MLAAARPVRTAIILLVLAITATGCGDDASADKESSQKSKASKEQAAEVERATIEEFGRINDTVLRVNAIAGLMSTCLVTDGKDDHTVCDDPAWFIKKDATLKQPLDLGSKPGGAVIHAVGPMQGNVEATTAEPVGDTSEMTFTVVFDATKDGGIEASYACSPDYKDICVDGEWSGSGGSMLDAAK